MGRYFLREQPAATWVDDIAPWNKLIQGEHVVKIIMGQCATGLKDSHCVLIKKPTEMMANDQSLLEPFARLRCSDNHENAVVSNTELAAAAQYTPQMQLAIVKAVRIAKSLPKHGNMQNAQAYVINSVGFDLDDPTLPRHSRNNEIIRPPPGGFGCTGCADNNFKEAPTQSRDPRTCRWFDVDPIYWKCPSCKK